MSMYEDAAIAQFENVNSLRAYPFERADALVSSDGRELPKDCVVDLHVVVPANLYADSEEDGDSPENAPKARLCSFHASKAMVSACIKVERGGKTLSLSATVSAGNFKPYFPVRLEKLHGTEDAGGAITFGNMEFPEYPETYFFENATLHPCCVAMAAPPRLRHIVDPRNGKKLSGDVEFVFSGHIDSSMEDGKFKLSLAKGSEEELVSGCEEPSGAGICGATPVMSINGIKPDSQGNIVLWFH